MMLPLPEVTKRGVITTEAGLLRAVDHLDDPFQLQFLLIAQSRGTRRCSTQVGRATPAAAATATATDTGVYRPRRGPKPHDLMRVDPVRWCGQPRFA